ncbi:Glycosyltransferase WbsX [Spirosomataceae bacterium TFI 002]|nr:Glycosyltransferase WbsX [Spirosomataceae bacterium TFI 002]
MAKPKVLAIHLPQFHPFSQNDKWWGKGFTEWTNVVSAKKLFPGHHQPQLPSDLGFYDLRNPTVQAQQAALAAEYAISGFCYYHYWFSGTRLMKEPIDQILASKKPDFPFCFFWANESWSRRWMGEESNVLIKQEYSEEDDYNHAKWLVKAFKDDRYIKINNRPLFLFYKPFDLPNPQRTIEIFREVCAENGVENPYLVASNSHNKDKNPKDYGFDISLNFETRHHLLWDFNKDGPTFKKLIGNLKQGILSASLKVYPYKLYKERAANLDYNYPGFPCVNVGFDNTARRGKNAVVLKGQNKEDFKESLIWAKEKAEALPEEEQIVFVNAWNEWAEGNQLEPSRKFGHAFLEAVKEVFA